MPPRSGTVRVQHVVNLVHENVAVERLSQECRRSECLYVPFKRHRPRDHEDWHIDTCCVFSDLSQHMQATDSRQHEIQDNQCWAGPTKLLKSGTSMTRLSDLIPSVTQRKCEKAPKIIGILDNEDRASPSSATAGSVHSYRYLSVWTDRSFTKVPAD